MNNSESPETPIHIPMLAGTMVVGSVIIQPIAPPRLSISTVANIATIPAITEESNIPPESKAMESTHLLSNL